MNKQCPECGEWFTPDKWHQYQKYCKKSCGEAAWSRSKRPKRDRVQYSREFRAKAKREGRCTKCGNHNPESNAFLTCPECRDKVRLNR